MILKSIIASGMINVLNNWRKLIMNTIDKIRDIKQILDVDILGFTVEYTKE